jgi:hypothetical protein
VPYVRTGQLGSFWDDVYKGAGAIADLAKTVQQGAVAGREVQAGNAQVTVVPTKQGVVNYTTDHASSIVPYVLAGGAALALVLAMKDGGRRRRR